ncbi:MAG: penicillin-binding protein [Peptococcaceae bacterium]|nr:penicillin-binding protein [Peptococcaceae bacterium]
MTRKRPQYKLRYGRVILLAVLLASFIIVGAGIGFVVGAVRNMPPYDINNITGDLSSFVLDKDNQVVTSLKTDKNRVELKSNEIPKVMKQAIVAIEDQRFYKHHGFDPIRLGGAVIANITKGYGSQGASTITQQLVKIAVLENPEKKLRRKVQELIIALQIENKYSKDEILALYLNNIYYGHGAHSLQTAAQTYFGKDAKDLTLDEAAMLAGVVNLPGRYSPYLNPEKAKQRRALVLNEMVKMNYITQAQADQAKEKPFKLAGLKNTGFKYQSFVDYVIDEAAEKLKLEGSDIGKLYTAGYKFYTTLDTKTQDAAEAVFADDKNFPAGKKDKIVQSAMVVLDPHTGEIRTLIGGRNQQGQRQFNRAVDATRQPGSAFKPIAVYAPALEKGYGPATVIDDVPEEYPTPQGPKTFVNYDKQYRGLISMRTAIQWSVNTTAVKMLQKIGVSEGFRFAKSLGISTLVESGPANDMGLSLALGGLTKGVSPLELTAAYGTFANQGVYVKPHAIRKIEDSNGHVIYEHKPQKQVVMTPQTAYLITDMLQTVVQAGTGTKAQMDRPVAGKTGTTSFDVDAWFVGYTPNLVGTVWMGYDVKEKMEGIYGGSAGAPIWKKVMTVAHKDMPVTPFPKPDNITEVQVDYKSGLLPSSLTPPEFIVTEVFNSAYVPTEVSNAWVQLPVCPESGQLLTDFCPTPAVTGVFLKRPIPWTGNVAPQDAKLEPPKDYCTLHGPGAPGTPITGLRLQGSPITDTNDHFKGVKLSWYSSQNDASTVFQIYRASSPGVSLSASNKVGEVSGGGTTWQDNNVNGDSNYYYRVVALNTRTGEQKVSNEIVIQRPQSTTTLKAPRLTGEAYINGSTVTVKLRWEKAAENRPVVYYIFRSETPNFEPNSTNQIAVNESITDTKWTDTGLPRGKTYYYRVIAFDMETNQQSPLSNQLKVPTN